MWIEKLLAGVLRVLTPLGARYIRPALAQRIYLLWIFRNFKVLPLQVLTPRQRRMIDALCVDPRFVAPDGTRWMGSPHPRNPGAPPAHRADASRACAGMRPGCRRSSPISPTQSAGRSRSLVNLRSSSRELEIAHRNGRHSSGVACFHFRRQKQSRKFPEPARGAWGCPAEQRSARLVSRQ